MAPLRLYHRLLRRRFEVASFSFVSLLTWYNIKLYFRSYITIVCFAEDKNLPAGYICIAPAQNLFWCKLDVPDGSVISAGVQDTDWLA